VESEPELTNLTENVETYNRHLAELKREHPGEYMAIAEGCIAGTYPDFDTAYHAVEQYRVPLVLQIGDEPLLGPLRVRSSRRLGRLVPISDSHQVAGTKK